MTPVYQHIFAACMLVILSTGYSRVIAASFNGPCDLNKDCLPYNYKCFSYKCTCWVGTHHDVANKKCVKDDELVCDPNKVNPRIVAITVTPDLGEYDTGKILTFTCSFSATEIIQLRWEVSKCYPNYGGFKEITHQDGKINDRLVSSHVKGCENEGNNYLKHTSTLTYKTNKTLCKILCAVYEGKPTDWNQPTVWKDIASWNSVDKSIRVKGINSPDPTPKATTRKPAKVTTQSSRTEDGINNAIESGTNLRDLLKNILNGIPGLEDKINNLSDDELEKLRNKLLNKQNEKKNNNGDGKLTNDEVRDITNAFFVDSEQHNSPTPTSGGVKETTTVGEKEKSWGKKTWDNFVEFVLEYWVYILIVSIVVLLVSVFASWWCCCRKNSRGCPCRNTDDDDSTTTQSGDDKLRDDPIYEDYSYGYGYESSPKDVWSSKEYGASSPVPWTNPNTGSLHDVTGISYEDLIAEGKRKGGESGSVRSGSTRSGSTYDDGSVRSGSTRSGRSGRSGSVFSRSTWGRPARSSRSQPSVRSESSSQDSSERYSDYYYR